MKNISLNWVLISVITAGLAATAQPASQSPLPPAHATAVDVADFCGGGLTYDQLTADELKPPPPRIIQFGQSPVALTISAAEYRDDPANSKQARDSGFCFTHTLLAGDEVSTTGELSSFLNGQGSFRGGGGETLAPEVFARLLQLMDDLPDDHRRVPPPRSRIVVEVQRDGAATVRLYDNADLPDTILEMLRLTGTRIEVATPVIKPDRAVSAEKSSERAPRQRKDGEATVSPDGTIAVLHNFLKPETLTVYKEGTWPHEIIRTIPEFWQPQVGGYVVNCEFSPDGRYVLVTWGIRVGALLFDTSTWQPVTDPHLFPQHLKEYLHTADWNYGIAVSESGETVVWDQRAHRVLARLSGLGDFEQLLHATDQQGHALYTEGSAEVRGVAFSPDGSRVAIYSGPDNVYKLRLSIFDIGSEHKERDLWPVEWMSYASGQPVWWNSGRWIVAPWSSQFSGGGTGIWDAETGRFIGRLDLSGCDSHVSPVADAARLLQPCSADNQPNGKVLEWSLDAVTQEIESARPHRSEANPVQ